MSRRKYVEVEVDLEEFEDEDIREEAQRRGLDFGQEEIADLATLIKEGDAAMAILVLNQLVGDSQTLRNAIELGVSRARRR